MIDSQIDFHQQNFDLNLLLKDMDEAPKLAVETKILNCKYRYTIKNEASLIKIGTYNGKNSCNTNVVSLNFSYTS